MPNFFLPQQQNRQREVERMKSVAQAMRDYGQQTPNEMVSGIVVKKSPIEALAKALGTAGAGYYEGKARRAEDDLAAQRNAQLAAVLSGGSPELQQLAAIDPQLALKTYADDIKRTNEMKNAAASGYNTPLDYLSASQGRTEQAKAGYDVMPPQQVFNPATGQYETRVMTREQAVQMANPSAPLSVRNNNPFNLRPTGQNQGFQQFQSPEQGMQAGLRDLSNKISGQSPIMQERYGQGYTPTIENIISTWAPPSENDTQNYINFISQKTGIDPKQPLTQADLQRIAPAMIQMEGGQQANQYYQPQMAGFEVKGEPSGGQKQIDDLFAKEVYTPYKIGGFADAQKQIGQVGGVLEDLKTKNVTGGTIGYQPNWLKAITNPQALQTQENIEQVVQRDLRQTLGAQFTEKEGERLISRAYNPKLDEKFNIERVQALRQAMVEAAKAKQDAIEYFDQNGTLAGWQGTMPSISSIENRFDELTNGNSQQVSNDPIQYLMSKGMSQEEAQNYVNSRRQR